MNEHAARLYHMIGQKTYRAFTFSVCDIPKLKDDFAEREAIMAIDASHPYVPALREAFKDVVRAAVLRTRPPVGEEGEEVGDADGAVAVQVRRTAGIGAPHR